MLSILIVLLILLSILYVKKKYFTLHGPIPGLKPQFLFGNLIQAGLLYGTTPSVVLSKFKEKYGDIFQFWAGPTRFVIVNNVKDVEHIFTHRHIYDQADIFAEKLSVSYSRSLISTRGAQYKRHAAIVLPIFRRNRIVSHLDIIIRYTDQLLDVWRSKPAGFIHTDIVHQCQNLLLGIFGMIGFNYELDAINASEQRQTNELAQALREIIGSVTIILYAPTFLSKLYFALSPRQRRARATIERYVYQMIDQELTVSPPSRAERKRSSLIASLVNSLGEDHDDVEEAKGLSREEVLDEMVAFLVAGHESISAALSWFVHLVSKHPRVQQKIREELLATGQSDGLSVDGLDSLIYLDCVINEVLRYVPPAAGTVRTLTMDDWLPENNLQLHRGDSVMISFCNLAHDPRYWSIDPQLFYPERFLHEDANPHPYAFIPFGAGHRQCIGQELARFELKVIAARMMQQVTFGDGGPQINRGGEKTTLAVTPARIGVTIDFS